MKLVGDVGGTKVLLAYVDADGQIVGQRRFASADFSDFATLLGAFRGPQAPRIDGGCLAVAGPVADDGRTAKITNLPWTIDTARLEASFGLGRLHLINDFAGVALGVTTLGPDQLVTVQAGEPVADGLKLVLGAGTGMGVAALLGDRILPSEGGHVGFAPADETQARVWHALAAVHGRVTAERVISGAGLVALHQILTGEVETAERIGVRALAGEATALQSVEVFFSCYGAFAGDMALAFMACGGVYLAGGVTQKLLPLLPASGFIAAFNAKAEHADLACRMPVHAVLDAAVGLKGAAAAAVRDFDQGQ
jgi:glucokinase